MASRLLYFPYINLPENDWTVRALLYYDTVGSIVPQDFFYDPDTNYEPFMLELVREQLVVPIDPMVCLERPFELNTPFINFVQSDGFRLDLRRQDFFDGKYSVFNMQKTAPPITKVNSLKFDNELLYVLCELGLARHSEGNWYYVEKITANYLMAYLATIIANKFEMQPTTDRPFEIDFLRQFRRSNQKAQRKRDFLLRELIPFPQEISLKRLQSFKEEYGRLLEQFRTIVEQVALDPRHDNDELLNEKVREMNYYKEELFARMVERNFGGIFFGSICGVFGAFEGLAQAETAGALMGGLPGFANAIYSAMQIERVDNIYDQTGMKYVALVDKKLRRNYKRNSDLKNAL